MHSQLGKVEVHLYNMQGTFRLCRMLPLHAVKLYLE